LRERDFYEEANSCSSDAVINSQETSPIYLDSSASLKSKVEVSILCPQKWLPPITKLSSPSTPKKSPNVPKRRGSSSKATKPRKKGRCVASPHIPSGDKKSTITAFFGRLSASGQNPNTGSGGQDQNIGEKIENSETNVD
jgi:hypothetical protein